jgi:O-antigen/teichoic acid export membrane protein
VGNGLSVLALVGHGLVRSGIGHPDVGLAREAVGLGARAHVGGVLATGSYRLDQWILGAAVGARELGVYSVAVAWFQGMFLLPQAVGAVIRPDIVRASKEEAARRAAALFRLTAVVTAVIGGAVVLLAPVLCAGVFGESFSDGAAPLRLLVAGAFGIVSLKILGNAMTAQGRPLLESAAMGAGFAVALALYITLIPWLGAEGAAIASTIAYSVSGVVSATLLVTRFHVPARDLIPRPVDIRTLGEIATRLIRRPAVSSG